MKGSPPPIVLEPRFPFDDDDDDDDEEEDGLDSSTSLEAESPATLPQDPTAENIKRPLERRKAAIR